jgi:protein associated with RNAse G/E
MPRGPHRADGEPVVVEKRKWDGTVAARWASRLVSRQPSLWCWRTDIGTIRERPRLDALEVVTQQELSVAGQGWWVLTAFLDADGRIERMKVDAATPVAAEADRLLWFVDLDLDLEIEGSTVIVRDEDVFVRRAREMGYPPEVCRRARAALEDVAARHRTGRSPFDGSLMHFGVGAGPRTTI